MKVITEQSQVRDVAARWKSQYPSDTTRTGIAKRLESLDVETATAADVKTIIGNGSWVGPVECNECSGMFGSVVRLGQEPDYESSTAWLCRDCLVAALRMFGEA